MRQLPRSISRCADITHFASSNQVVKSTECLLNRRGVIPTMGIIKIDVIGLQPAQTAFDRLHHLVARCTPRLGPSCFGNENLVASSTLSPRPMSAWPRVSSEWPAV